MRQEINWQWREFTEFTPIELEATFLLRQSVFVIEQDCVYQDIDGKDGQAIHLLGWQGDKLVATLRVFEDFEEYKSDSGESRASMGRICTHADARSGGVGQQLVAQGIEFIHSNFNNKPIEIGAQFYLKRFYESFGFVQASDIYDEDGIDHIHMLLEHKSS